MPYSKADTGSFGPGLGKKEQTVSECASLTIGTVVSHNSGTSASMGNRFSCAQAYGNENMSLVLTD